LVATGGADEGALQPPQAKVEAVDGGAHPEFDVGDDVVVAAAAGVELAADVPEALDQGPLDVSVDVLQGGGVGELPGLDLGADVVEGGDNLAGLVGGEQ